MDYSDFLNTIKLNKEQLESLKVGFDKFFNSVLINTDIDFDFPIGEFILLFPKNVNQRDIFLCMRFFGMGYCENKVYWEQSLCDASDVLFGYAKPNQKNPKLNSAVVKIIDRRYNTTGVNRLDDAGYMAEQVLITVLKLNMFFPYLYGGNHQKLPNGEVNKLIDFECFDYGVNRESLQVMTGSRFGVKFPEKIETYNQHWDGWDCFDKNHKDISTDDLDKYIAHSIYCLTKEGHSDCLSYTDKALLDGFGVNLEGFSEWLNQSKAGFNQLVLMPTI